MQIQPELTIVEKNSALCHDQEQAEETQTTSEDVDEDSKSTYELRCKLLCSLSSMSENTEALCKQSNERHVEDSICPYEEKEGQVIDHSEEKSTNSRSSQITGVVYWNGKEFIFVWLNFEHWKEFEKARARFPSEAGEMPRTDEPKDRAACQTLTPKLCDYLHYSSANWKALPYPDESFQKMILDHFDEQPKKPDPEVAALRQLRALEKKFIEDEQERLLDHISNQMNPNIPKDIRADVIRSLRDVDNERLIECETRPTEFSKYIFMEVERRRAPKEGDDDTGLANYEIVGGKVLTLKSDRQEKSVDLENENLYRKMRLLDHLSNEGKEENYYLSLRLQQPYNFT